MDEPAPPVHLDEHKIELYEAVARMLEKIDDLDSLTFHDDAIVELHAVMAAIRGDEL